MAWIEDREAWIQTRCRAMQCRETQAWTDEYGNGWCERHGSMLRPCSREHCFDETQKGIAWCDDHAYRQALITLAALVSCPMVTLPDGRVIPPGLPTYAAVARWYSDRDYGLVFGVLFDLWSKSA